MENFEKQFNDFLNDNNIKILTLDDIKECYKKYFWVTHKNKVDLRTNLSRENIKKLEKIYLKKSR